MNIYPAIDISGGKAVRLTKGDYNTAVVMSDKPYDVAHSFINKGADRLHIVDLDGAKSGELSNFDLIADIVGGLNAFVEVGGGIRDEERIEKYLAAGVSRVILGTVAVKNFAFVKESVKNFGDKIAVGIDCNNGLCASDGWLETSKISGYDFAVKCRDVGVSTVIYTDIATDGAMKGTNLKAFDELTTIKGLNIIASGGVSSTDELYALKEMNVEGVILGKAIYYGLIDLGEAVKIARGVKK